jgi:Zn-finger nucleic acid-binding protein
MNLIFPNCSSELGIMSKFGVEIDQSPRCKGVWLDIGELKKSGKHTEQIRG